MLLLQRKPQQSEIDKQVSLEAKIDSSVNQKIVQFNSFKKVMADRKDLIEQDFASFCLDIENKRTELKNEVALLEDRRKESVKPLDNERNALLEAKNDNLRAVEDLNDKILIIDRKINNLEAIEDSIKISKKELKDDRKSFSKIKTKIEQSVVEHQEEKRLFEIERQEFDNSVYKFRKDLDVKNNKIKEKELALNILLEENKKRSAKLDIREKRIESKQETLKKAFEELNIK